ncbi:MAG TPA: DoxX family protein [Myxococcaceae bacterium]|nr:DoxX family protein [Myxococcaceae bacterium]
MKGKVVGYWIATALTAVLMGWGGVMDFLNWPTAQEIMKHLGYPNYVAPMLGAWKILGTIVILAPGLTRVKEWAYAGIVIDLIGAGVSHMMTGDGPDKWALPFVFVLIVAASSILRPPSRVFGQIMPGGSAPASVSGAPAAT